MQTNQINTEAKPRGSIHSFKASGMKSAFYNTEINSPVIEEVKPELEGK